MDEPSTDSQHASDALYPPPPPPSPPARRRATMGRRGATAAVAGGLVAGGIAGGYMITQAATTSTPTPSASTPAGPGHEHVGGGPAARTQDLQQAAGVIGITETDLQPALSGGQTIAAVATSHSISPATVISTLVTDENAEIDAAVSSGQLTATQATQMKSQTTQRVTDFVDGTRPAGGPGGRGGMPAEDQQVVATAMGINTTELQTEEAAGKTIAAIATAHNVNVATVINALAASENGEIDQQVASGRITAAQAAQLKAITTQRVTDEVNGTRPAGGPAREGGGHRGTPPAGAPSGSAT